MGKKDPRDEYCICGHIKQVHGSEYCLAKHCYCRKFVRRELEHNKENDG